MKRHYYRTAMRVFARMRRFVFVNILHTNDPPHRLALGLAIGIFVTFTPTIGMQMMMVVGLAWLLRANATIGIPVVWISNPATFVPIYYPSYWLGRKLLGSSAKTSEWWAQWYTPPAGGAIEVWKFYWGLVFEIAAPLWVGCLVVASTLSVATYAIAYQSIALFRKNTIQPKYRRWIVRKAKKDNVAGDSAKPTSAE